MKQWRFQPGTVDGNPVRVMITVDLTFTLRATGQRKEGQWVRRGRGPGDCRRGACRDARLAGDGRARPADWIARRDGAPNEWFGMRSQSGTQFVIVTRPDVATFDLRPPAAPAAIASIAESVRRAQPLPDAEVIATGQIQTQAPFYVWSRAQVADDCDATRNPPRTESVRRSTRLDVHADDRR